MKKNHKILIIIGVAGIFLFALLVWLFSTSPEAQAKDDFIKKFDLQLEGKVLNVEENQYGQYLVCLKVLKSNYKYYFPIHNPNKFRFENSDFWEERFFIKVEDSLAVIILTNKKTTRILHNKIIEGSLIKVNTDKKKRI